jgi:hypothetical protein
MRALSEGAFRMPSLSQERQGTQSPSRDRRGLRIPACRWTARIRMRFSNCNGWRGRGEQASVREAMHAALGD